MRPNALSGLPNNARPERRRRLAPAGVVKTTIRARPEHRRLLDPLSDACGLFDGPCRRSERATMPAPPIVCREGIGRWLLRLLQVIEC